MPQKLSALSAALPLHQRFHNIESIVIICVVNDEDCVAFIDRDARYMTHLREFDISNASSYSSVPKSDEHVSPGFASVAALARMCTGIETLELPISGPTGMPDFILGPLVALPHFQCLTVFDTP